MRTRGFEVITAYADKGISIPERKTASSAGYDLEAAADAIVPPKTITVIPTGLKAYMEKDEYLSIFIRSSLAFKEDLCWQTTRVSLTAIITITLIMKAIS